MAKVKKNQRNLLATIHEIEASSELFSHYSSQIQQSEDSIEREVFVYNSFPFPWDGIIVHTLIRIDKSVNGGVWKSHYFISNDTGTAKYFLKKVLQEWTVETMHFYKDCTLYEDSFKVHKGAFSLSVLRSIVLNVLHLEALALFSFVRIDYRFLL